MAKTANKMVKSTGRKKSKSEKVVFGIALGFFILYAAFILFFFVFAFLVALRKDGDAIDIERYFGGNLFSWPANASFNSFIQSLPILIEANVSKD